MSENHGVKICAISCNPVPITDVEYIEDIYDEIMKYEKQGKFIYKKCEELTQWRIDIIRGHFIRAVKTGKLMENPNHPQYELFCVKFPKYWKEVTVLHRNGLL